MIFTFIVLLFEATIYADWVLVQTFYTGTIIQSLGGYGLSNPYNQCITNPLQFEYLTSLIYSPEIRYKGFQIKVIFDMFQIGASTSTSTMQCQFHELSSFSSQIFTTIQYLSTDQNQMANRICTGGADSFFIATTQVLTLTANTQYFHLHFSLSTFSLGIGLGIRNLIIYVNSCYPTCLTCSGQQQNQCLTCYYGTPLLGICQCDPQHQFSMTSIGCLQECPRDYYITDQNSICISDKRIKSNVSYFIGYTISTIYPFKLIQDPQNLNNRVLVNTECIYLKQFVGKFQNQEGVFWQIGQINALKFIRLRITFVLYSLQTDSTINIYSDDILQSQIIQQDSNQILNGFTSIYTSQSNTLSCQEKIIRLESVFRINTINPIIKIQGSLGDMSESWGFFNFTLDAGLCQENCQICQDSETCSQCNIGYLLYQNGCIQTYPVHSQNGIDYSDEYQYSRYLVKGFYNLNMSIYDINTYFDSVTNSGTNFKTGQSFSFFPDKFVLGGVMVWFDASYIKQFSISQPHYAISIRFNFTFGDQYPGQFTYYLDTIPHGPFTIPSSSGQNQVGKSNDEITQYFYTYLNPHTSNTLNIEFKCQAPALFDIRDGFCAISDYFIVVHYCPPFCITCSSSMVCISWYSGYSSPNCPQGLYLTFDESTSIYSCISCSQIIGCVTCTSLQQCTQCTSTANNQFFLSEGVCYCHPFTFLSGSGCTPCNHKCEKCYGPTSNNCLSCISEFHRSIINHQCLCQSGYYDDGVNLPCMPICGDQLIVYGEDCDDGNYDPYDGCDQCKFYCQQQCNLCVLGICEECHNGFFLLNNQCLSEFENIEIMHQYSNYLSLDSHFYESDNCQQKGCKKYKFNSCLECNYGYYLKDKIFLCSQMCENEIMNQQICQQCQTQGMPIYLEAKICESNCGDFVVASNEDCDSFESGCKQCKYQCQPECLDCQKGVCLNCIQGWGLVMNYCIPTVCGDQIIMPGYEDCDDGNQDPFDGCNQCMYECQDQCTNCKKGICYECNVLGWYLNDNICLPYCGDGIITEYEQCDDNNDEQYDGCYNCQYQCQEQCTLCERGICYECNILGWLEQNNKCKTYCGDGLINGLEQCDDQNNNDNDGCYQCKYKCDQDCINCQDGICFECFPGRYILQTKLNRCETVCGDGYYVENQEQCDDGNDINNDGCNSNCIIEDNYACLNTIGQISNCIYSKQPQIILTKLLSENEKQIVQLTFTQQMMINQNIKGDILNSVVAIIQNISIDQYSITIEYDQKQAGIQFQDVVITLTIRFYYSIQRPLLIIQLVNNPFISQYGQSLENNESTIILDSTFIISDSVKSVALSTQSFNKIIIYLLISLSLLCLLTGSSDLFWNLLDQLQLLSYIKYINIQFPMNLNMYFEAFKLITISPLLKVLKIDNFFSLFDGLDDYSIQPSGKFLLDNQNAYFLYNFQSFLFCLLFSFVLYLINNVLKAFLYRIPYYQVGKFNYKVLVIYQKILISCKNQSDQFFYNGILRLFMSNWYDLSFATIMQLTYYKSGGQALLINQYLAITVFVAQVGIILFIFGTVNSFFRKTTIFKKKKYQTLFEDIKKSKKVWVMQYNSIILLKKQLYIFILVFMQQLGVLQVIQLTMLQTFFLIYLMANKPLINRFEYLKFIITEIILIFNSMTFLLYTFKTQLELSQNSILNLGWTHILTSSLILAVTCLLDLFQQLKNLLARLQKIYKNPKPQRQQPLFLEVFHNPQQVFQGL